MKTPPSPKEHVLVQTIRYMRDPIGYLGECQRELGDVFTIRIVKQNVTVLCSPELAKAVYTAADDVLVAGEAKIKIFGRVLGRSSTLLLDGAEHLKRRRLMLPRFRGEIMQTFAPVMVDACTRTLDDMPRDKSFALHPFMHQVTFEVILRALFSATPANHLEALRAHLLAFATRALSSRLLMFPALQKDLGPRSPWGKVVEIVTTTRRIVLEEIARRRREGVEASDITGLLMAARHDDGTPLEDEEIRDELLTMLAAGHETTSMALTWLCSTVFSRPDILDKLLAELATQGDTLDVDKLPYCEAVIRESLRFNTMIPNGSGRLVKKAFDVGGFTVPPGSFVNIALHAIHRRSEVFERPDEFVPERFLDAKYSPYESVAFGGGMRRCLGMPFALFEMKLVLATMLQRFRLEIQQKDVKPVWRGMFLTPNKGLVVRVRPLERSVHARAS